MSSILDVLNLRCQLDSQAEMSIGSYPGCGVWEKSVGWNIYLFGGYWHMTDIKSYKTGYGHYMGQDSYQKVK